MDLLFKVLQRRPSVSLPAFLLLLGQYVGCYMSDQSPAFGDHPCDGCVWTSPGGAYYDLSALCDQSLYQLRLDNPRGALLNLGICAAAPCTPSSSAYACLFVPGNPPTSAGEDLAFEQIETNVPTAGLRVIMGGGEPCDGVPRKTIVTIECTLDEPRHTSVPAPVRGWEGAGDDLCVYHVLFQSPYGCPTYPTTMGKLTPQITAVTGCLDSQPKLSTQECLPAGGTTITIHGVNFMLFPSQEVTSSVQIGPFTCDDVRVLDGWRIQCVLGAGTGEGHALSLNIKQTSEVKFHTGASPVVVRDELFLSSHSTTVSFKPLVDYRRGFDSFMDLGVGGLTRQITELYQRAFASRGIPASVLNQLGIDHAKGILLYGPPGSGKTLLARTIADILKTDKVTLINAPEIMSKFLGESEKNLRSHFAPAEKDWHELGEASDLHVIIIDEIDAICKRRGKSDSSAAAAAYDSVVNQLLTKMDGLKSLHNVLVIGMTNRKDMIDPALLRPGRFEIQIEIGLPDEEGRWEIFTIHTREMKDNNYLAADVDVTELTKNTTHYSGAEIAGLVRLAASFALDRKYGKTRSDSALLVSRADFIQALAQFKPAFTQREDDIMKEFLPYGYLRGGLVHEQVLETMAEVADRMSKLPSYAKHTVLFYGPHGVGKSGLAAYLSKRIKFDFVKVVKATDLLHMDSLSRNEFLVDVFYDAHKADFGLLVLDDLHLILESTEINDVIAASSEMVHTLHTLIASTPSPGHKLVIVGTLWSTNSKLTTCYTGNLGLNHLFHHHFYIPPLDIHSITNILNNQGFTTSDGMSLAIPEVSLTTGQLVRVVDCVDHWLTIANMDRSNTPQGYFDHCVNTLSQ